MGEDIKPHDVVIALYSLSMFDMQEARAKIDVTAKRCVYLVEFAGGWMDGWMDGWMILAYLLNFS